MLVLAEVKALTSVELVSIKYLDFIDILRGHTEMKKMFKKSLEKHMQTHEEQLLKKGGRLPPLVPVEKSLGQGELFSYDVFDKEDINVRKRDYLTPFWAMGMY